MILIPLCVVIVLLLTGVRNAQEFERGFTCEIALPPSQSDRNVVYFLKLPHGNSD